MRIALVSQEYPPETAKGGIGAQAILKAHGLAARGHEIHVISRAAGGQRSERMDGPVHVLRVPGFEKKMPVYTEAADWLTYSAEVCAAISSLNAHSPLDLIEFPEWACEGYVQLINRTEWNYIPVVIHLHGPLVMFAHTMGWPEKDSDFFRIGRGMEETCLRSADAIYSSSAYSADWCAREYELDKNKIPVIHTGVDTELFFPQPGPRDPDPTIVYTGKLVKNKGVPLLVEAACRLAREIPGLRLKLIGRGEENVINEIRAAAEKASCPDLLNLTGFLPRETLPQHLSRAHVFAAPSEFEGGPGFMYLEAMACGIPVIACSGSGASEVVLPEKNGLLVPRNDLDALCAALRRLLTDKTDRERMGTYARSFVLEHADSRKCIERIDQFFKSIVANKESGTV